MSSSFAVTIVAGRKSSFSGVLSDAAGNTIAITAGSKIYFKLYRGVGATPDLDINGTALTGGSVTGFTAGTGNYTVTIFAADCVNLIPGTYDIEVALVDAGDSNAIKHAQFGVAYVLGQPLGGVS